MTKKETVEEEVKKPYNYGKWSEAEHEKFLEGLRLYGTKWVYVTRHL